MLAESYSQRLNPHSGGSWCVLSIFIYFGWSCRSFFFFFSFLNSWNKTKRTKTKNGTRRSSCCCLETKWVRAHLAGSPFCFLLSVFRQSFPKRQTQVVSKVNKKKFRPAIVVSMQLCAYSDFPAAKSPLSCLLSQPGFLMFLQPVFLRPCTSVNATTDRTEILDACARQGQEAELSDGGEPIKCPAGL